MFDKSNETCDTVSVIHKLLKRLLSCYINNCLDKLVYLTRDYYSRFINDREK